MPHKVKKAGLVAKTVYAATSTAPNVLPSRCLFSLSLPRHPPTNAAFHTLSYKPDSNGTQPATPFNLNPRSQQTTQHTIHRYSRKGTEGGLEGYVPYVRARKLEQHPTNPLTQLQRIKSIWSHHASIRTA
jgi:hypothetical protein